MKGDQAEGQPGTPGHKVQGFISAPLIVTKLTQLLTVNVKQQMIKKRLKSKLFMLAATVCFHSRQ